MADEPNEPAPNLDAIEDGLPAVVLSKDHHLLVSPTLDKAFVENDLSVDRVKAFASHL